MRLTGLSLLFDDPESFRSAPPAEATVWHRPAGPVQGLFDLAAAERLSRQPLSSQMVSVVSQSKRVPGTRYTWAGRPIQPGFATVTRPRLLTEQLESGATLVFESLQRTWQPVGDLCRRLAYELGVPVSANAYLTPAGAQGFAHHYDTHDVLIVQAEGSKTWQLHRPIYPNPLEHQPFARQPVSDEQWQQLRHGTPFLEVVLHPGDVLWIPRGWIHNGFATDEPSLHVTYSIAAVSRHWIATELVRRLDRIDAFRTALPWGFAQDPDARAHAIEETAKLLVAAFSEPAAAEVSAELADAYAEFFLEPAAPGIGQGLGLGFRPGHHTELRVVPEAVIRHSWQPDGGLRLHLADQVMTVPAERAALAAELLTDDGRSWTISRLLAEPAAEGLDEAAVAGLIGELIGTGVVRAGG